MMVYYLIRLFYLLTGTVSSPASNYLGVSLTSPSAILRGDRRNLQLWYK